MSSAELVQGRAGPETSTVRGRGRGRDGRMGVWEYGPHVRGRVIYGLFMGYLWGVVGVLLTVYLGLGLGLGL